MPERDGLLAGRRRVHVVGAGGSGMSSIATVLAAMGHRVSGSDLRPSAALERLAGLGVRTWVGHDPAGVADADLVAVSTAVPADDPEVAAARSAGVPVLRRAAVLAAICAQRRTIAVAGTHGKTTTSSMLAVALDAAGLDPSYVIGGDIAGIGPGARWGSGELMVVEADESDGTFTELGYEVAVVTNLEADHLEHHGSLAGLTAAFDRFAAAATAVVVTGADDEGARGVGQRAAAAGRPVRTFAAGGAHAAAVSATAVTTDRHGASFDVRVDGVAVGSVRLQVPGLHNVRNALAALAAGLAVGGPPADLLEGLAGFRGVGRRAEWRGERDGITFVDDYGHLPGEVAAMLAAARSGGWGRVVAVFQPHRYSRTEALWRDFGPAFADADVVVVTDVYASGEAPRPGVDGSLVADAVRAAHPGPVHYVADLADLPAALEHLLQPGDLCLTLGAGDLTTVVDRLVAGPA
ncbi:MAG TPA: UDP-N-acetylmuramate--L-alanine ligase [Acidimicrobiales bacterium]|nr:UDP-N-acetylmuramate--L-alanine ligase [Acidimicrobiales bacterium]